MISIFFCFLNSQNYRTNIIHMKTFCTKIFPWRVAKYFSVLFAAQLR